MVNLSRLEEIKDLRTVWPHEALDFTPWLSQDDNIALLADAVGLDITVEETESSVGDFNVDIFASETAEQNEKLSLRISWRILIMTTWGSLSLMHPVNRQK